MLDQAKPRAGFVLYFDSAEAVMDRLTDAQLAALLRASVRYNRRHTAPDFGGDVTLCILWDMWRTQFDRGEEEYWRTVRKSAYANYCRSARAEGRIPKSKSSWDEEDWPRLYELKRGEERAEETKTVTAVTESTTPVTDSPKNFAPDEGADTEIDTDTEPDTENEPDTETETETGTETDTETDTEIDTETETDTETDTESETDAETVTGAEAPAARPDPARSEPEKKSEEEWTSIFSAFSLKPREKTDPPAATRTTPDKTDRARTAPEDAASGRNTPEETLPIRKTPEETLPARTASKEPAVAVRNRTIPSPREVEDWCAQNGVAIDTSEFWGHYTARNWRLADGTPVRDWKTAARGWEKSAAGLPADRNEESGAFGGNP